MQLISPNQAYKQSYMEALRENYHWEHGVAFFLSKTEIDAIENNFEDHLAKIWTWPDNTREYLWLVDEEKFIGALSLRYVLSEKFQKLGGHVGYGIRPSERGKDYGKHILRLGLEKLKQHGIGKVLVTCADENVSSYKVIEANGGTLESKVPDYIPGKLARRYWINIEK